MERKINTEMKEKKSEVEVLKQKIAELEAELAVAAAKAEEDEKKSKLEEVKCNIPTKLQTYKLRGNEGGAKYGVHKPVFILTIGEDRFIRLTTPEGEDVYYPVSKDGVVTIDNPLLAATNSDCLQLCGFEVKCKALNHLADTLLRELGERKEEDEDEDEDLRDWIPFRLPPMFF